MASLDQIEGDAIELGILALIVFIIIALYLAWKGINTDPLKWLQALAKWLEQEFANLLKWLKNLPTMNPGGGGAFNPFGEGAGTSAAPSVQDPNPVFQIPDVTAPLDGLLPLQSSDIYGGQGSNSTDSGGGGVVWVGPPAQNPYGGS